MCGLQWFISTMHYIHRESSLTAKNEKEGSITCCGLHTSVVRQTDLLDLILPAIQIVFGGGG